MPPDEPDQTMPEMTGIELAKKIPALRADTPIIR
jgi:hypothetical protein